MTAFNEIEAAANHLSDIITEFEDKGCSYRFVVYFLNRCLIRYETNMPSYYNKKIMANLKTELFVPTLFDISIFENEKGSCQESYKTEITSKFNGYKGIKLKSW